MSKYQPLSERLRGHPADQWKASFSDIEEVLGFPLPKSAQSRSWWSNDSDKGHVKAWTEHGWHADEVDPVAGLVTFRKSDIAPTTVDAALGPVGDLSDAGDLDVPEPPPPPYAAPDAMAHASPALQQGGGGEEPSRPTDQAQAWKARPQSALARVQPPKNLGAIAMVAGGVAVVAGLTALLFRGRRS